MIFKTRALYQSIIKGGSSESINEINNHIKAIHSVIKKHQEAEENIIFVTHDFFMRVIEVYIKREKRLSGIKVSDLEKTLLNYYFGGFRTNGFMREYQKWGTKVP